MDGDNLLLGMHRSPVDLATFHPDPVTAFKMWQLYIDHVDPLLKITHVPTLQPRFIAAIGNVGAVKPPLEALMFGVYSLAVLSLSPTDCAEQLGMSREELLTKYQFGCEQALMNAGYLRSADLQCLTAMTMHLVSVSPGIGRTPRLLTPLSRCPFARAQTPDLSLLCLASLFVLPNVRAYIASRP